MDNERTISSETLNIFIDIMNLDKSAHEVAEQLVMSLYSGEKCDQCSNKSMYVNKCVEHFNQRNTNIENICNEFKQYMTIDPTIKDGVHSGNVSDDSKNKTQSYKRLEDQSKRKEFHLKRQIETLKYELSVSNKIANDLLKRYDNLLDELGVEYRSQANANS